MLPDPAFCEKHTKAGMSIPRGVGEIATVSNSGTHPERELDVYFQIGQTKARFLNRRITFDPGQVRLITE